ncbi:MAG: hypothetical protein ACRCXB_04250 [Aeromonadaceae bacterium]
MNVVNKLAVIGAENPLASFIVIDKVGLQWGFGDTPILAGNTWNGQGKSMIGACGEGFDTEYWDKWVWSREAGRVVELNSLRPSGRIFSWDDVPEYETISTFQNKVRNAKDRNIRFTYSFAQFHELIANKVCCITGVALEHKANGADNSTQFSIDRLDPIVGYEPGNCVVMSGTVNVAKSDIDKFLMNKTMTDEQKLKMIYKVENVLRKRIKAKAAAEEARTTAERDRKEAFGAKFAILPPVLRG